MSDLMFMNLFELAPMDDAIAERIKENGFESTMTDMMMDVACNSEVVANLGSAIISGQMGTGLSDEEAGAIATAIQVLSKCNQRMTNEIDSLRSRGKK